MGLKFDGSLRWICPKCGEENPDLRFGGEREGFVIEGSKLIPLDPELAVWLKEWKESEMGEDRYFRCPHCGGWVDAELVRDGFREWLRNMRREDPETYAKHMSKLLDQVV
jgi:predicted RNA-binding Zn-ribbon protein involved in translation (DUF1610 family)